MTRDALINSAAQELYAAGPWGTFEHFADGGLRAIHDAHDPHVYQRIAEAVVDETLAVVMEALERGYHAQNPTGMHPVDYLTKRLELDGHEGFRTLVTASTEEQDDG